MIRVLRETVFSEMKFFTFLSLTFNFNIKFQYNKRVYPAKSLEEVVWGCGRALGWINFLGFYISPHLMFSITFVSVMHFHNQICISISPKIPKEIFACSFCSTCLVFVCCFTMGCLNSSLCALSKHKHGFHNRYG